MTHGKKATAHVVALVLALSLFVYGGKMASHDLYFWGSVALAALVAALALASAIYVAYGREAARHPRPRFPALLRRMEAREAKDGIAELS